MPTAKECTCCHSADVVQQKFTEPAMPFPIECITEHPGFDGVCLNIWALEVAYLAYKQKYGKLPVSGPNHDHINSLMMIYLCITL
jgi:hypothetical protein